MVINQRFEYGSGTSFGRSGSSLEFKQKEIRDRIIRKLETDEYSTEYFSCTVCENADFDTLSEKGRYGIPIPVKVCRNCGLVQNNPRLDSESAKLFYEKEYRELYNLKHPEKRFDIQYGRSEDIFQYLQDTIETDLKQLSILEVGCGYGGLIAYFEDQGCNVKGIDIDKGAVQFAQEKGLPAEVGDINDHQFDQDIDLVILDDVLEHLINPKQALNNLSDELSSNTVVYIESPGIKNMGIFSESYDCDFLQYIHIAHTHHFTMTSLKNLTGKNYKLIDGNEHIRALFKNENDQDYTIQQDYENVVAHIHSLERYRWANKIYQYTNIIRRFHRHPAVRTLLNKTGLYPYAKKAYDRVFRQEN